MSDGQLLDRACGNAEKPGKQKGAFNNDVEAAEPVGDVAKNGPGKQVVGLADGASVGRVALPNGQMVAPDSLRVVVKPDGRV